MNIYVRMRGLGAATPPMIVSNQDLEKVVDTNNDWIVSRTGIQERHLVTTERSSDLGFLAAQEALKDAGIAAEQVTHLLVATCTPDSMCPNTACLIAGKLNIKGQMALDINAGCSGFIYGLELVKGLIAANKNAVVLLIATDVLSQHANWADRSTCILFGDGAGAAVFTHAEAGTGLADLESVALNSDGSLAELITMNGRKPDEAYKIGDPIGIEFFIQMNGREVFKQAVRHMAHTCKQVLQDAGLGVNDIDVFIPHQANLRIIEAVGKQMSIDPSKVFSNVHAYGNTSAASILIAMVEAREKEIIRPNQRMLIAAFGSGLTWGAALFKTISK